MSNTVLELHKDYRKAIKNINNMRLRLEIQQEKIDRLVAEINSLRDLVVKLTAKVK